DPTNCVSAHELSFELAGLATVPKPLTMKAAIAETEFPHFASHLVSACPFPTDLINRLTQKY
ncbi:MAG: hypothetical protein WA477_20440, partial [Candidatus Sulfotelmatobacter sp.]